MSTGFSIFTKVIAVILVIAMCVAIVPSTVQASGSDCDDEYQAIWDALALAVVGCGGGVAGCAAAIASGIFAWACYFLSAGCYLSAKSVADKIIAYWNCRDQIA